MDGHRFDDLTRALAARGSRRGFVAGLAALAAGLAGARSAAAACPPEQVKARSGCVCKTSGRPPEPDGHCPCPVGQTRCGAVCVKLADDPDNCGACGAACPDEGPCVARRCRAGVCANRPVADGRPGACAAPNVCCGGACTDLGSDLANCGTCGNACGDSDLCTTDACVGGSCQHTAVDCTRGPCEVGICDGASGSCLYDAAQLAGMVCREAAGPCDVAEACDGVSGECPPDLFQPNTVQCRSGGCVNGVVLVAATCPGSSAVCPPTESIPCAPYTCDDDGIACRDFCESNGECIASAYCNDNNECVPDEALGAPCDRDSDCLSGHCVGDVCCQQACPVPFGAVVSCVDGLTCSFVCDSDYSPCGDACCPNDRTCCGVVCCGEGGECDAQGECTVSCLPLGETCGSANQCCLTEFIECNPVDDSFEDRCCHALGGPCGEEFGQCCLVDSDADQGYAQVACAPAGVCGGGGALCSVDEACLSGSCCDGVCCATGLVCGTDFVCRAGAGTACGAPGECASGLCCGGVCVPSNEANCAACGDVCAAGEECAGGVCLTGTGQPCSSGAQCAAGFCHEGVCCDECGGLCGRPRPENTPCGDEPGSYCCSGECLSIDPHYFSCGGCSVTCPFGDICTDDHTCTCTESSSCPGGTGLITRSCHTGGLCVTTTEGELACVMSRECGQTCSSTADCTMTTSVCIVVGGEPRCSSDWVCTESTCCGRRCSVTMPGGRPI